MFRASLYIIQCTARNRLRVRLRRLREPRYLIGAIVGAAYIYFSFFARFRAQSESAARRRARSGVPANPFTALAASGPALTGVALLVLTALGWLLPFDSGLFDFSKAEVQFLFPAPVTRRSLLVHRLLRSQLGMLFSAVIVGLVMPSAPGFQRLRIAVGMWLLLATAKVYFTGVTLARARLGARERTVRRVAWLPLTVLLTAIAIVGSALWRTFAASPVAGARDALNRVAEAVGSGAPRVVAWPFMAVAWPLFAPWPQAYLWSLAAASAVLVGCVAWVLRSDETFQDAAEEVASRQAGDMTAAAASYRTTSAAFPLAAAGRPEMVFAWKAAMQTIRLVDRRSLVRIAVILFACGVAAASAGRQGGLAGTLAAFSLAASFMSVLLAPQAIRIDMRQDLQHLELLKTWPLPAAAVVRGQLIWPGVLISALAWIFLTSAIYFSPAMMPRIESALRFGVGGGALILAPGVAFAQLAIQNATALIFPAWVPQGAQRARGLDAMGQRIITLGGTWLALLVMTLPGAIAGGIVWFAFRPFVGSLALIPAALVCSLALFVEVIVVTELLGPAYDRLDLLAVERAE